MTSKIWINSVEGAKILSQKTGRNIDPRRVRDLAEHGRIRRKQIDGRTWAYNRRDIESITLKSYSFKGEKDEEEPEAYSLAM